MSKRSTAGIQLFVSSLAFVLVVGSFAAPVVTAPPAPHPDATPQIADCSKATDSDIVKAVTANINKRFKPDDIKKELHFSVSSKDGVVSISGDAHGINRKDPRGVRTTITKIVRKTSCVKKVVTKHFTQEHPIKCAKTQKPCNGGCIGQNEECNPLTP